MVVVGFIPEGIPNGPAYKLPETAEHAQGCTAPKEEATAPEAAPKGQGMGLGVERRAQCWEMALCNQWGGE